MNAMEEADFALPRAGITLRGRRRPGAGGPPILCLHGILDNCASFDALAEHLPGHELIAIDLPGHGLSDPWPALVYGYLDYAACVLELAHTQGWDRFRLIGHSLGGAVSSLVAGIHPEKIDRMVLIDAIGPLSADPERTVSGIARYLDGCLRGEGHPVYRSRTHAVKTRVQLADILLETAETLVERDLVEVDGGFSWRHDPRLNRGITPALGEDQILAFLRAVTADTLLVTAERTALVEPFYPARIAAVPGLRQVTLAGGHHLHMENTEKVAAEIGPFLAAG